MSCAPQSRARIAADAAAVFERLAEEVGPFGVIALVVGTDGDTIDLCISADDDAVEERSMLLLDLYAGDALAVVFATARAGLAIATPYERARYRRLRAHGDVVDLPVLDWLICTDGPTCSLATPE
ncbi:MAG: hypothetical protein JWL83_227 [Actinomycetia bacterium]|jgi:hypothetical protein|nr:hypothetical protein [Actinomycetes bacterium]